MNRILLLCVLLAVFCGLCAKRDEVRDDYLGMSVYGGYTICTTNTSFDKSYDITAGNGYLFGISYLVLEDNTVGFEIGFRYITRDLMIDDISYPTENIDLVIKCKIFPKEIIYPYIAVATSFTSNLSGGIGVEALLFEHFRIGAGLDVSAHSDRVKDPPKDSRFTRSTICLTLGIFY